MTDERRKTATQWGPYLASGTVLALFLIGQLQSCGQSEARLSHLEELARPALEEHRTLAVQINRHDVTIDEINRRLTKMEDILDRAPWVRQSNSNRGGMSPR